MCFGAFLVEAGVVLRVDVWPGMSCWLALVGMLGFLWAEGGEEGKLTLGQTTSRCHDRRWTCLRMTNQ